MSSDDSFFVPTRCSAIKPSSYQFVAHENKKKDTVSTCNKLESSNCSSQEKNVKDKKNTDYKSFIRQGRFDMFKFLQSKEKSVDKFKMDEFLAIRLGAIPRKKKSKNYREYKSELEEQKLKLELDPERKADVVTQVENPIKKKKDVPYAKKRAALRKKGQLGGMLKSYGEVTKPEIIKLQRKKRS